MRTPLRPSSSAYWPVSSCPLTSFRPTTAGMRSERAMMAVCEVLLPTSVAKPSTLRLSSCAVLEGVRSWLMMMHGSLRWRRSASSSRPSRLFSTRVGHVAHIGGALAQVFVLDGGQGGGVAFGDGVEGVLGVDLLLLDHAHDLVEQRAVFQHQQMGVEDAAFLGAHAFAHLALDFENLVPGLDQRLLQAIDLLGQLRVGQLRVGRWWGGRGPARRILPRHTPAETGMPRKVFSPFCWRLWHG